MSIVRIVLIHWFSTFLDSEQPSITFLNLAYSQLRTIVLLLYFTLVVLNLELEGHGTVPPVGGTATQRFIFGFPVFLQKPMPIACGRPGIMGLSSSQMWLHCSSTTTTPHCCSTAPSSPAACITPTAQQKRGVRVRQVYPALPPAPCSALPPIPPTPPK